ncbi:DUF6480 family protein [Williamsia sp. SKLECPSW1]
MTDPDDLPDRDPDSPDGAGSTPPAAESTSWVHDDADPAVTRRFPPGGRTGTILAAVVVLLLLALVVAVAVGVGINYAT